jgi:hypothetical protein
MQFSAERYRREARGFQPSRIARVAPGSQIRQRQRGFVISVQWVRKTVIKMKICLADSQKIALSKH